MADYLVHDTSLAAVADAIRAKNAGAGTLAFPEGFVSAVEAIAGGSSVADAAGVAFGYENDAPVQREKEYAVAASVLNELGAITQSVSGRAELVTVEEMIYWLARAKFIPQGNAQSSHTLMWRMQSAATGTLQEA